MFRRVPPAYADGAYEPSGNSRPNPIEISDAVFNGSTGTGSGMNRTAFLVFFGKNLPFRIYFIVCCCSNGVTEHFIF